jgi:uncharacterized protein (TIGR03435 family)
VIAIWFGICRPGNEASYDACMRKTVAITARATGGTIFLSLLLVMNVDIKRPLAPWRTPSPEIHFLQGNGHGSQAQSERTTDRRGPVPLLAAGIIATIGPSKTEHVMAASLKSQSPDLVLEFDVASVKPNKSGDAQGLMRPQPGGRFLATNVTLRMLIRNAYQLPTEQIADGPSWMNSDRFDVVATATDVVPQAQVLRMLQALLTERFKLQVHREMRDLPVYALVMARRDRRLGPQLRRVAVDCTGTDVTILKGQFGAPTGPRDPNARCGFIGPGPEGLRLRGMTMEDLAKFLQPSVRRPVIDRTGLTGYFDLDLPMTAEIGPPPPPPGLPDAVEDRSLFPTIFTAVQERLGLKLESTRAATEVLIIDRAEKPTPD